MSCKNTTRYHIWHNLSSQRAFSNIWSKPTDLRTGRLSETVNLELKVLVNIDLLCSLARIPRISIICTNRQMDSAFLYRNITPCYMGLELWVTSFNREHKTTCEYKKFIKIFYIASYLLFTKCKKKSKKILQEMKNSHNTCSVLIYVKLTNNPG